MEGMKTLLHLRTMFGFLFAFSLLSSFGCGAEATAVSQCPGPGCACTGSSCACNAGASCQWVGNSTTGCNAQGGSCNFACLSGNQCTGSCQGSCSGDCRNGSTCNLTTGESGSFSCEKSTCTVTVGKSGSVSCNNSATCHVTCTGSCSVSCSGGSSCDLKCATDSAPKTLTSSGNCP